MYVNRIQVGHLNVILDIETMMACKGVSLLDTVME